MKQIYWIDDNIEQMLYIIQGAIAKLWKIGEENAEGIASKLIIFGNACDDADTDGISSQEDEDCAKIKLEDMLRRLCARKDGPNKERPAYNARKKLVRDKVSFLYKRENLDDKSQYQSLKQAWITKNLEKGKSAEYKKASDEAEKLIQRMNVEPGNVVGIVIALLYGDMDRLREKKRIISMELYNKLSNLQISCFMYSSEADDDELMRNWCEIYQSLYQGGDVKIYQRSDFMQKAEKDIIYEIEEMFEQTKIDK